MKKKILLLMAMPIIATIGNSHGREVTNTTAHETRIVRFVRAKVQEALPSPWREKSPEIARAILDESRKNRLDPLFTLAVIEHESKFDPRALGSHGEQGLMQLKPTTAAWIATKQGHHWRGSGTLWDPVTNIALGTAYLSYLRRTFQERGHLYLCAYNMGARRLKKVLQYGPLKPTRYASRVLAKYASYQARL